MADETPGIEPGEVVGHAEPDTGQGDSATSEIPEGVDALSDEQVSAAQERGGGDDGDDGALDVSAVMDDSGDAGDADASGDADVEGAAADEAGDEDVPEKTDVEAPAAPDTGEAG